MAFVSAVEAANASAKVFKTRVLTPSGLEAIRIEMQDTGEPLVRVCGRMMHLCRGETVDFYEQQCITFFKNTHARIHTRTHTHAHTHTHTHKHMHVCSRAWIKGFAVKRVQVDSTGNKRKLVVSRVFVNSFCHRSGRW